MNNLAVVVVIAMMMALTPLLVSTQLIQTANAQAQMPEMIMLRGIGGSMGEDTTQFIKDYLVAAIQSNVTSATSVTVYSDGRISLLDQGESITDSADDTFMIVASPFTEENGYSFEGGKVMAPNGTQILPR